MEFIEMSTKETKLEEGRVEMAWYVSGWVKLYPSACHRTRCPYPSTACDIHLTYHAEFVRHP
jgi:hypothetical protein